MTLFWLSAGLLLAGVVAVLSWTLFRQRGEIVDQVREQNLRVARDKLRELEADHAAGNLDDDAFRQAREELERELLEDTSVAEQRVEVNPVGRKLGAALLLLLIPGASVGLYLWLGSPQLLEPGALQADQRDPHAGGGAPTMAEIRQTLERRVAEQPDDAEAWFMLGRLHAGAQRFAEAAEAYAQVARLTDRHPQALIAWADALAMTQGGRISGKPYELVKEALEKAPEDPTALWLAGQGAREAGDYQNAIYFWRRAEAELADQPEYVKELRGLIEAAKNMARAQGVEVEDPGSAVDLEASVTTGIPLEITLAPELADRAPPDAPLFVFAKAVDGPPMPVAALRLRVRDLPAEVVLEDAHLLQGGRLADHARLKIGARIALTGEPTAASGDLQSAETVVETGVSEPVKLVIDQVVP